MQADILMLKLKWPMFLIFLIHLLVRLILNTYLKILKMFPKLYGMAYSLGNESYLALAGRK